METTITIAEGLPQIGDRVRETITDRTGIVTGVTTYLWGCTQYLVYLEDADGNVLLNEKKSAVSEWLDLVRLEVVDTAVRTAVAYDAMREPAMHGSDRPAPIR